jgi:hypothetical protein
MKRHGNLWHKIVDIENIKLAHKNARKGKTHYTEVKMVDSDIEKYCHEIKNLLESREFTTSEYTVFTKKDKGKVREIYKLPYFPDRIVQHALMQVVETIWKGSLIADTYQSIKGRGVHRCLPKIKKAIQSDKLKYFLQIDIKKFYPSIDNEIMKQVIRKKIKCTDTLWLIDNIVESNKGLPIGNYVSQYLGNLYLSKLDHSIKEDLGAKNYYRYCDDLLVLSDCKNFLHKVLGFIAAKINAVKLKIKDNYRIAYVNIKQGLDFLGYVIYPNKVLVRKSIKNRMKHYYSAINKASYSGILMHCNGYNLQTKLKENL